MDGTDIKSFNIQWLRQQIGLVSQEPTLFDLTIAENIRYGANFKEVTDEEIQQAAKSANIHDFIMSLPQVSSYCLRNSFVNTHSHAHTYTRKHTHTYRHTHACTHTHTHTHIWLYRPYSQKISRDPGFWDFCLTSKILSLNFYKSRNNIVSMLSQFSNYSTMHVCPSTSA